MKKRYIKEYFKKVKERKWVDYRQVHPTSPTRHSLQNIYNKYTNQTWYDASKLLVICKHDRGVKFGTRKKQVQLE